MNDEPEEGFDLELVLDSNSTVEGTDNNMIGRYSTRSFFSGKIYIFVFRTPRCKIRK
jgi:hypothetical protein